MPSGQGVLPHALVAHRELESPKPTLPNQSDQRRAEISWRVVPSVLRELALDVSERLRLREELLLRQKLYPLGERGWRDLMRFLLLCTAGFGAGPARPSVKQRSEDDFECLELQRTVSHVRHGRFGSVSCCQEIDGVHDALSGALARTSESRNSSTLRDRAR